VITGVGDELAIGHCAAYAPFDREPRDPCGGFELGSGLDDGQSLGVGHVGNTDTLSGRPSILPEKLAHCRIVGQYVDHD